MAGAWPRADDASLQHEACFFATCFVAALLLRHPPERTAHGARRPGSTKPEFLDGGVRPRRARLMHTRCDPPHVVEFPRLLSWRRCFSMTVTHGAVPFVLQKSGCLFGQGLSPRGQGAGSRLRVDDSLSRRSRDTWRRNVEASRMMSMEMAGLRSELVPARRGNALRPVRDERPY